MTSRQLFFCAYLMFLSSSCKWNETSQESAPQAFARGTLGLRNPPLRSATEIADMKGILVKNTFGSASRPLPMAQPKIFRNTLLQMIVKADGLPRSQLKYMLSDLVSERGTHCDGRSCARVFGMQKHEVDHFLNETQRIVENDASLQRGEYQQNREILLGSLTKQSLEADLLLGEPRTWREFVHLVGERGSKNDALRSSLVPIMQKLDAETRMDILNIIKANYASAYKVKFKAGTGIAPKRAYDVILRYLSGPEKFFRNGMTSSQALDAWRKYFINQKSLVFGHSDFGTYTPDDVLAVARRMQSFLVSKGSSARDVNILLKGSFPAGKANLRKKNPFDNILDSVTTGFDTSYSDIDFLINAEWEKPIKEIEPDIYSALVSKESRAMVSSSKAKPFFQTHPDPFDLFAELDGSIMSPVGLRINQQTITLVVYNALPISELPSRETLSRMNQTQKDALYKKWARFYKL